MSSGALFGGTSGRSQSKNLVEFRAGKMTMKGRTVTPDKRKGTVYIYQSDDSLMHFCWRERSKSTAEDVISHLCLTECRRSVMLEWLKIQPPIFMQFFAKMAENAATRKVKN